MLRIKKALQFLLPFHSWRPFRLGTLPSDLFAGITIGMVLIPQSMAYAQLAGLPSVYGLYAAFLPVIVAALWGTSNYLSTGPVAMTSLLTASALAPLAIPGSELYIEYAILLAVLAGLIRIVLGLLRMGMIVNFLSHPVLIGFTNAAAVVIVFSQINKIIGVPRENSGYFINDILNVFGLWRLAHWPSIMMGLSSLLIILLFKKKWPKVPGVLLAVILSTAISWAVEFERQFDAEPAMLGDSHVRKIIDEYQTSRKDLQKLREDIQSKREELSKLEARNEVATTVSIRYELELMRIRAEALQTQQQVAFSSLRQLSFARDNAQDSGQSKFMLIDDNKRTAARDKDVWHLIKIDEQALTFSAGGRVIGEIQAGLPPVSLPPLDWRVILKLLPSAFILVLIGFMEAFSIAKVLSTKTRERIHVDRLLISQGLANLAGGLTSSYPVSGSFSRSALNYSIGAKTGFSSVVAGLAIMMTLLFFTPLLYHLPQAVLAAIIISAVLGLFNFSAIVQTWKAMRRDGTVATATFFTTLLSAPHLEFGVYLGVGLSIAFYLHRNMRPRIALLGRHKDGTLRDMLLHKLKPCKSIAIIRYDGSLVFVNAARFEEYVRKVISQPEFSELRYIIIEGSGINKIDATGVEVVRTILAELQENDITLVFSGLKKQVLVRLYSAEVYAKIGALNSFRTPDRALESVFQRLQKSSLFNPEDCPLRRKARPAMQQTIPEEMSAG